MRDVMVREFFGYNVLCVNKELIEKWDLSPMKTSLPMACAMAFVNEDDGTVEETVLVNYEFTQLPNRWQEACVLHEIGHIELGHLNPQAKTDARVKVVLEEELAADNFAVERGYKDEIMMTLALFMACTNGQNDILKQRLMVIAKSYAEE